MINRSRKMLKLCHLSGQEKDWEKRSPGAKNKRMCKSGKLYRAIDLRRDILSYSRHQGKRKGFWLHYRLLAFI